MAGLTLPTKPNNLGRRQFLGSLAIGATAGALLASNSTRADEQAAKHVSALPTALIADEVCKIHQPGVDEPESPNRFDAVLRELAKGEGFAKLRRFESRAAVEVELRLVHGEGYVALAKREIESGAGKLSTGDTRVCRESYKAALHAAGAACVSVDAVLAGKAKNAFCVTRPPGHHATADKGMGFCVFNNVAVAARYAQQRHKIGKVLIVDWDVHHGNGTQDIFYEDGSVFYCSTHQSPWYPWTGESEETGRGKGLGTNLNLPFKRGAGRKEFLAALESKLLPAAKRFRPELVFISAGFDARQGDPLGKLELTDEDFADMTKLLLGIAKEHAQGKLVSVLEGGYNLAGLASAAAAHCAELERG